jgi:hypothetical protein
VGIGINNPATALHVAGTITATAFQGNGSGLANVVKLNERNTFTGDQIINNGRVGSSTANPSALLSLGSELGNTKLALWDDGDPTRLFGLGMQGYQFRLHLGASTSRFSFLDAPDGNELLTIKASGKVGIGIDNPQATLHVMPGAGGLLSGILLGSLETGSSALRIELSTLSAGHALLQGIKLSARGRFLAGDEQRALGSGR